MRRLLTLLLALAAIAALAGCGGDDGDKGGDGKRATTGATTDAEKAGATGCEKVPAPRPKGEQHLSKPTTRLDEDKTYLAEVLTNCGRFTIRLDVKRAPRTAASFASLARKGFYDGLTFHRIVAGFVIQGGDPLGNGQGGPGYSVVEAPPEDLAYTRGVVAMAKTQVEDPGTSGSQFFVVTGEDAQLPPEYALAGKVVEGLDVVDRIGVLPIGADEQPTQPVVMRQVKIVER